MDTCTHRHPHICGGWFPRFLVSGPPCFHQVGALAGTRWHIQIRGEFNNQTTNHREVTERCHYYTGLKGDGEGIVTGAWTERAVWERPPDRNCNLLLRSTANLRQPCRERTGGPNTLIRSSPSLQTLQLWLPFGQRQAGQRAMVASQGRKQGGKILNKFGGGKPTQWGTWSLKTLVFPSAAEVHTALAHQCPYQPLEVKRVWSWIWNCDCSGK